MDQLIILLDFLSRAFAVLLAVGAFLGFVFRKWVEEWIKARFKRQVDQELKDVEHKHAVALEEKRNTLAKDLNDYTEHLKTKLSAQFERENTSLMKNLGIRPVFLRKETSLLNLWLERRMTCRVGCGI